MKEMEDLKKKHKLKDDFLTPKPSQYKNKYGVRGKSEPLLGVKNVQIVEERSLVQKFFSLFKEVEVEDKRRRKIFLSGYQDPIIFSPNIIKNQKYSMYSLIPMVLFNQFKFFSNLFFLLIAISQIFPPLRVGFLFSYVAPLTFVLVITLMKEAVDDYKRYKKDMEQNTQKFIKLTKTGEISLTSAEISVGDLIKIHQNERIPADMVLIYTSDKSKTIFLRTDQLDGETDWKLRKPVQLTQEMNDVKRFINDTAHIIADPPNKEIYKFEGNFVMKVMNSEKKESLSLEQTMWANTVLASSMAIGVVIYTGNETRAQKNSSQPETKFGALDLEINAISKALFIFMGFCAVVIVGMNGFEGPLSVNLINIFRFVLLLSSIIPISLRVNLDFAKIVYSFNISNDSNIPGTIARNSTIPEELGRIQFLFTDKTGTLTKNEMVFKQICFESGVFTYETVDQISAILLDECKKSNGPLKDYEDNLVNVINLEGNQKRRFRRKGNCVIRDCITALGVCHNVTPVYDNQIKEYQASSPDEVALVKFADSLGIKLESRTQNTMTILNAADKKEEYEILANFPFSSETKRMGILVKHVESNRLIFYLKGAEVVMEEKVQENSQGFLRENCESLASSGLRTLVISQKYLTWDEYETWKRKYEFAKTEMENREEKVRMVVEQLEKSMEFLAVTGVEDKLQDDVSEAIESLRNAGVKIWMLTGDKVETATCIAISTGLKTKEDKLFFMKEMKDSKDIEAALNEFEEKTKTILVIDGVTLTRVLNPDIEKSFFDIASKAPAVVCCRVSPTQKTLVVRGMKKYSNKTTCGIGDGGNDVGMILEAHCGVGIVGKEGMQASLAADFSILEFKALRLLILWHGRLSYKRSAVLSQFVIHRGLIISIIQVIFSIMFYFSSIPIYNGYLMLGYATVFTNLPVFSIVYDEDVSQSVVLRFPNLYKILQKGRVLSTKTFLIWCFKSIYQGSVIMLGAVLLFENVYLNIVSITFTALIFAEILNVYLELHKFHYFMLISFVLTLSTYLLSMFFLQSTLNVSFIFAWECIWRIILITVLSWFPFWIFNFFYHRYYPETHEKVDD